jgi:glutathione S-transferase
MKLYMHPASTTSRAVALFVADNKLPVDFQVVDIFTGEHMKEPYTAINPNKMVPVLEDGDFRLTESASILRYLAEKTNSPAYPKDLKQRAKVNEVMDWFNSNLYRDWAYGLIYPQIFPTHKRPSDESHKTTIEWGKERAKGWLQILNDHILGPKKKYLCGDDITIADYFAAAIIQVGEVIRVDMSAYPNVKRWLDNMKKRPAWSKTYEVIGGFAEQMKAQAFVGL